MSSLICRCGSVVPVEESVGMECRGCHERPLKDALEALRPFAHRGYEVVEWFDAKERSLSNDWLRTTISKRHVLRARELVEAHDHRRHRDAAEASNKAVHLANEALFPYGMKVDTRAIEDAFKEKYAHPFFLFKLNEDPTK